MNHCTSGNCFIGVCTEQAKMSQYLGNDCRHALTAQRTLPRTHPPLLSPELPLSVCRVSCTAYGYGYYGCGNTYRQGSSKSYGSPYRTGDIITVVLDCDARKMSFKKNDEALGVAFEDLPNVLYPALSLYSKDDSVSIIDFGQHV